MALKSGWKAVFAGGEFADWEQQSSAPEVCRPELIEAWRIADAHGLSIRTTLNVHDERTNSHFGSQKGYCSKRDT